MCCQRTLEGVFTIQPFSLLSYSINLNDNRYECVAVQEDGEEVTTFVDLIVLFAPIIEQEEAYVRRRDGGREVRQKEDSKSLQQFNTCILSFSHQFHCRCTSPAECELIQRPRSRQT